MTQRISINKIPNPSGILAISKSIIKQPTSPQTSRRGSAYVLKTDPSTILPSTTQSVLPSDQRHLSMTQSEADQYYALNNFSQFQEEKEQEDEVDIKCGYCGFHPRCLQLFNGPYWLLFITCCYAFAIGFIVNGVYNVINSTLEIRFNMTSAYTGYIASCYNVTASIVALILGKFAKKNKARYFGLVVLISSCGSFVFAIPHFATGLYQGGVPSELICEKPTAEACGENSALAKYFFVFLLGQFLHGAGGTALFTVAASLLDDSVAPSMMPLVLGCMYASNLVGMGAGFVLGSKALKWYVDFDVTDDVSITPDDPRWVGAWWPLYFVMGAVQLLITIPLFGYGTELPTAAEVKLQRISMTHKPSQLMVNRIKTDHEKQHKPKELSSLEIYKVLIMNPCFMFIILALAVEGSFLTGCAAFMSKYIETMYRVPSSESGTFAGAAIVPSAMIGLVLGGVIAKKYDFTIKQNLKFVFAMNLCAAIGVNCMFIQCDPVHIIGINKEYNGKERTDFDHPVLSHECNEHCPDCSTNFYEPVCSEESGLYFSPCFAGCSEKHEFPNKTMIYSECRCVRELNHTSPVGNYTLSNQNCFDSCNSIYLFCGLMFFAMLFSFLPVGPLDSVTFRCVSEEQKSDALGFKTLVVRLFGTFCGPNIVGQLIDSACVVNREQCGEKSSCWIYKPQSFLLGLYGFIMICKSLVLISIFMAHRLYKPPVREFSNSF